MPTKHAFRFGNGKLSSNEGILTPAEFDAQKAGLLQR